MIVNKSFNYRKYVGLTNTSLLSKYQKNNKWYYGIPNLKEINLLDFEDYYTNPEIKSAYIIEKTGDDKPVYNNHNEWTENGRTLMINSITKSTKNFGFSIDEEPVDQNINASTESHHVEFIFQNPVYNRIVLSCFYSKLTQFTISDESLQDGSKHAWLPLEITFNELELSNDEGTIDPVYTLDGVDITDKVVDNKYTLWLKIDEIKNESKEITISDGVHTESFIIDFFDVDELNNSYVMNDRVKAIVHITDCAAVSVPNAPEGVIIDYYKNLIAQFYVGLIKDNFSEKYKFTLLSTVDYPLNKNGYDSEDDEEFVEFINQVSDDKEFKIYLGFDFEIDIEYEKPDEEEPTDNNDEIDTQSEENEKPLGTYIHLQRNDGSGEIYEHFSPLEDGPKTISEFINDLHENNEISHSFISGDYNFDFTDYTEDVNDKVIDDYEYANFTFFFGEKNIFMHWDQSEREKKNIEITVHKNDGSGDTETLTFDDFQDVEGDEVDYIMILDGLSENFKLRSNDTDYIYIFTGLSKTSDGKVVNTTDVKFTESCDLYLIWDKEKIIPITPPSESDKEELLKSGELSVIKDMIFVQPKNAEVIKKMVYCNNFYYILCDNNRVYKLVINNTNRVVVKIFDLSAYDNTGDNDIFACDNALVMRCGKYLITDNETIKANFGIDDSSLLLKIDETIQKLNTKTIVKIDVK